MALGCNGTRYERFIHLFDFGLAREYIVLDKDGRTKMRRPRARAHFRGTIRYCSPNAQERGEQGRPDDLWCLLYMMAELRGPLPWTRVRDRSKVLRMKREVEMDKLLENCPVELLAFAEHLTTLNYYIRPDYSFLYHLLEQVLNAGNIK
ncbi:Protein kinase domain-containing protein [Trichostrongylus colubriformis]|uniref:Protein kinase domain-containing protein n=1 Tax=Trichostrongylus colubriformis TaxID=6319 RepID=A0AAN8GCD7_TRICO